MSKEKMNWIYEGVSGLIDKEEYLTGKKVDKTFEIAQLEKEGKLNGDFCFDDAVIPSTLNQNQYLSKLDYELKSKEDPLFEISRKKTELIKEFLSNPIKMKRIKELLEESLKKDKKHKKHKKYKKSSKKSKKSKHKKSKKDY